MTAYIYVSYMIIALRMNFDLLKYVQICDTRTMSRQFFSMNVAMLHTCWILKYSYCISILYFVCIIITCCIQHYYKQIVYVSHVFDCFAFSTVGINKSFQVQDFSLSLKKLLNCCFVLIVRVSCTSIARELRPKKFLKKIIEIKFYFLMLKQ